MLKKLDRYIIGKFLGTFVLSIALIMSIVIIMDITEKIDKFFEKNAPLDAIIFDYYLNLIPFYFNMLSPLFTFLAVIFFTSKLAGNTEIVAIQASGVSYNRFLRPYFISATIIAVFTFILSGYVIPKSNEIRLDFENQYVKKFKTENVNNVQLEVEDGVILFIQHFEARNNRGLHVSMEKFEDKTLVSRMTAKRIKWDSAHVWTLEDYLIRDFDGMKEKIRRGSSIDTTINIQPNELFITAFESPQMTNTELKAYLDRQQERGVGNIKAFEDEYYKRFSMPLAAYILMIIGVTLSSRKVRGGTGVNIAIGIVLSFAYIIFSTFSTTFSVNGSMPTLLAAWLPNIVFTFIAFYFYRKAIR